MVHPAPVNLSVDTAVTDNQERPKSPWTPSYSVTSQGPGIVEPEIESDIEDEMGSKVAIPETLNDEQHDASQNIVVSPSQRSEADVVTAGVEAEIARPKSPYPPSYSVHQMGPGMQEASLTSPPTLQPVIVTNSLSTDSAYTQLSDAMSPSQETGTNVTTPDVETLAMPKIDMHEGSEAGSVEPLDEETTSPIFDKRFSSSSLSRTPSGTDGASKSLGITHTLAMRSFPSTFSEGTDNVSALDQFKYVLLCLYRFKYLRFFF